MEKNQAASGSKPLRRSLWEGIRRLMNIRPKGHKSRFRWVTVRRLISFVLRWTFIVIGAVTASAVMFSHLYAVNESIYDPSLFAIGVGGLFSMICGVMLMVLSRNGRQRLEIKRAAARCEELADHVWELKESEERATSLLEAQGDLIIRRDSDGRITYANDAFCRLAGKPHEALLGTMTTLTVLEQGDATILPDGTRVHDQSIKTEDGARWLAWREVLVWAETGDHAEVQSVGRDVTDRTKAEQALGEARDQAEAASRAKSRFLAMVSHEIRTPLNGILGMADLLLDTPLTPEQATYARAAKTSGDALLSLIEEILDFSKIEAGKLDLEEQPFALVTLIEDVVELLGPRAQAKGLEIAADVDDRLPERVMGDATRLRQVLLNLAGNAIKFTEAGGIAVVVEAGAAPDEIVFEVRDTGIGIASDEQARIFLEFEQAEGGSTRKFGGTGLGLAISKQIVERMGGRIELESMPGNGATFRVTLTLARAGDGAAATAAPDLGGMAVLIVAPPSIGAVLVERRLIRWGAIAATVEANAAPARLSERRWDAVLVDHALGADLSSAFARSAADTIARRIVLITPSERHGLPGLEGAGFTGYLVKPVRAASLAARLLSNDAFESVAPAGDFKQPEAQIDIAPIDRSLAILIAEDNEINALLARSLLAKLGHRPVVVPSGDAALDAWRASLDSDTPFDLVLMDVQMPGVDGLEATRRIRTAETENNERRTPIIALTANAFAEDRNACLAAGMDGFLVKPLDRERLATVLARLPNGTLLAA